MKEERLRAIHRIAARMEKGERFPEIPVLTDAEARQKRMVPLSKFSERLAPVLIQMDTYRKKSCILRRDRQTRPVWALIVPQSEFITHDMTAAMRAKSTLPVPRARTTKVS